MSLILQPLNYTGAAAAASAAAKAGAAATGSFKAHTDVLQGNKPGIGRKSKIQC